ncbi:MAG: dihydrodipicolinate synthase family protein [Candidatus Omnitrophota bacterium]
MKKRYPQAILLSCEIPWDEKEELMEDLFRQEIRDLLAKGFHHVYIFGTCGEGYAVDTRRFRQIVDIFVEETHREGIFPQVGTIGLSTANIIERLDYAHNKGIRMFQISLPSWGALDDDEVDTFFEDVCGAFPDSRFLHYNNPRAKRTLSGKDYRRVCDRVPNLAATKNGGTDMRKAYDLMTNAPELQHFFGEYLFPLGSLYGECSLLSSFGAVSPTKTRELFAYVREGKIKELFELARRTNDVWAEVFAPSDYREAIDGAYDKMLVRFAGLPMPLRLLSPYHCFPEEVYQKCKQILEEKYPDWLG